MICILIVSITSPQRLCLTQASLNVVSGNSKTTIIVGIMVITATRVAIVAIAIIATLNPEPSNGSTSQPMSMATCSFLIMP